MDFGRLPRQSTNLLCLTVASCYSQIQLGGFPRDCGLQCHGLLAQHGGQHEKERFHSTRRNVGFSGMLIGITAHAQSPTPTSQQSGVSQHHQIVYELMKDMSQEISQMTEQLSHGELSAEQKKDMAQKMKRMSTMMQRMSGLQGRPEMREAEAREQMNQMRKEMDEIKALSAKTATK